MGSIIESFTLVAFLVMSTEITRQAGRIILLNGASSSGKSTLARCLQAELSEPFWHYSIDNLLSASILPQDRISAGEFPWSDLRQSFFEGFHRSLPAFAWAGNNLIVEHIVETAEWMDRLAHLLEGLDVFFVGVHCPLEELERRERERGDRRLGDARKDFETTHALCAYHFEVSSTDPSDLNSQAIIAAWLQRASPSAISAYAARG